MVEEKHLETTYYTIWLKIEDAGLMLFFDRLSKKRLKKILKSRNRESFIVTKTKVRITHDFG